MSDPADAIETVPENWIERGARIAHEIDRLRWALADWAVDSGADMTARIRELPADFPLEQRQIRKAAQAGRAFPIDDRDPSLPFEVYLQLLRMRAYDRPANLATARAERWGVKQATAAASQRRREVAAFEDDDPERLATLVYRAWNNAPAPIREHAWALLERAARAGFALVDEESPVDA